MPHLRRGFITPKASRAAIALSQRRTTATLILAILAVGAILLRFPPTQYSFYPQCPIHLYLGILCPGCGTTRALAALLCGHLLQALQLNALTTLLIPASLGWIAYRKKNPGPFHLSPVALSAILTIAALFTLARNL
ncbi:DUF2752 domain-containing protein [Edaphobacter modestus]|uniref:DUF2752 domain-containing protein n=1 Tax=Edaphobacter modestus TaxID=388466 RepID=UPI0013EED7AB|nr:DUF2752 domain-containing protein [Edaphobacter modestus]